MVRSSVHRNRIKRILRELFRRHAVKHAGLDLVVALRAKPAEAKALRDEVAALLDQALGKAR